MAKIICFDKVKTSINLQEVLGTAAESRLIQKAFWLTPDGWSPKPQCLTEYYSSGEKVISSILLHYYFLLYGSGNVQTIDSITTAASSIWPGATYWMDSATFVTDDKAREALEILLPRDDVKDLRIQIQSAVAIASQGKLRGITQKAFMQAEKG